MTNLYHLKSSRIRIFLILLLLVIIAAESVALYTTFTTKYPGANDFFVRWLGGRAYLLEGINPYDQLVAEDAQKAMFGRLTTPEDKDEAYFAYPLYTLFFFWPLSLMPYAWAQAIWMTLLQFMLLGTTLLSIWLSGWRPPPWLFGLTIFWGIFFYKRRPRHNPGTIFGAGGAGVAAGPAGYGTQPLWVGRCAIGRNHHQAANDHFGASFFDAVGVGASPVASNYQLWC